VALLGSDKDRSGELPGSLPKPPPTRRRRAQLGFLRLAGIGGVVGVATAIAAIMGTQDVDGWIVGLVAACVALFLATVLRRGLTS